MVGPIVAPPVGLAVTPPAWGLENIPLAVAVPDPVLVFCPLAGFEVFENMPPPAEVPSFLPNNPPPAPPDCVFPVAPGPRSIPLSTARVPLTRVAEQATCRLHKLVSTLSSGLD